MAFVSKRRTGAAAVAVLATAVLVGFGTGLHPLWPLLWLAPIPALLYAAHASWRGAALAAFLGWLLGSLNMAGYYGHDLQMPLPVVASILVPTALVFALAVLLFRALFQRGAIWSALIAAPALWVSVEYVVNLSSPHGTAGSLAYSQLDFLPFLQLASVTGPWGMSFLLLLLPTAVAIAILHRRAQGQAWRVLAASVALVGAVLVFGAWRLHTPPKGTLVNVGLVASDYRGNANPAHGAAAWGLLHQYAQKAVGLAAEGAQAIVLPEKLVVLPETEVANADALFQAVADNSGAVVVVGAILVMPEARLNSARVYTPSAPVQRYDKHHMLPAFESQFTPGTALILLSEASGTWGVEICKDMDFTPLSRKYGRARTALLLVPAWDFVVDRWSHGHMAIMRGVESGFAIVRSAKQGYLTVSDSRGRVLAETTSDAAPLATLLAEVPVAHSPTLYARWGDWFAWLALALLALVLLQLARVRGRISDPPASR